MSVRVRGRAAAARMVLSTSLCAVLLGACAQSGEMTTSLLGPATAEPKVADAAAPPDNRTELEKATEYWGKRYREKPTEKNAGLSYAKNLKAMGEKRKALAVLQQLSMFYGQDKEIASEYGRLALDQDQLGIAKQMLAVADDPGKPDWRVISAQGTVLAKEGKFAEAVPVFERALMLAPEQTSVMNNLALAYAMGGEAARAEEMLRKIETAGGTPNPKVRQNLALVLGLQGKFDESKAIASAEIGQDGAAANATLMRQFVKANPAVSPGGTAVAGWRASIGEPGPVRTRTSTPKLGGTEPVSTFAPTNSAPTTSAPVTALDRTDPAAPLLRGPAR